MPQSNLGILDTAIAAFTHQRDAFGVFLVGAKSIAMGPLLWGKALLYALADPNAANRCSWGFPSEC